MSGWQVLQPGLLSTVQDTGRVGFRHLGVAVAGALDAHAAWLANRLLDNDAGAGVLELTLRGPTLRLPAPATIALTGACVQARFEGTPVPMGRPLQLPAGTLTLGGIGGGVRSYLAVAGGVAVPPVLGSRSTDLRGGFGGVAGRALQAGDVLPVGASPAAAPDTPQWPRWWVDITAASAPIRYVPSDLPSAQDFSRRVWQASARSDRQGLRLQGDALAEAPAPGLSEPVAPGTVQLPPDGQPIVLLADAQTVGGYPRLGHVIGADLPRLAQVMPGQSLRFEPVTPAQARAAACEVRARMARIGLALHAARR